jgi:hypothetical protein
MPQSLKERAHFSHGLYLKDNADSAFRKPRSPLEAKGTSWTALTPKQDRFVIWSILT